MGQGRIQDLPVPSPTYMRSLECVEDSRRWFGDVGGGVAQSVPHHTLSLCGEVGEFANIIKKIERGSLDLGMARVRNEMAMELADIYIYLLNIAGLLHIDLEKAYDMKRTTNEKRFMEERRLREEQVDNG